MYVCNVINWQSCQNLLRGVFRSYHGLLEVLRVARNLQDFREFTKSTQNAQEVPKIFGFLQELGAPKTSLELLERQRSCKNIQRDVDHFVRTYPSLSRSVCEVGFVSNTLWSFINFLFGNIVTCKTIPLYLISLHYSPL